VAKCVRSQLHLAMEGRGGGRESRVGRKWWVKGNDCQGGRGGHVGVVELGGGKKGIGRILSFPGTVEKKKVARGDARIFPWIDGKVFTSNSEKRVILRR